MNRQILYPDEGEESVKRHSSIDQFEGFLSVWKQGGWAPIVFDQLDGITCDTVKTHPVVLSFGDDIGYVFPEAHCQNVSDKLLYFDKEGVEQRPLPECFGGKGEFFDAWVSYNTFVNFDDDSSLGIHNVATRRVGLDYCLADKNLPPAD